MVSLCPLVSRLSLFARTSAAAARILKEKTLPALGNRGVEGDRVVETRSFSVKSHFDGDDCGGGAGNKENKASVHEGLNCVSLLCPLDFELSREDFDIIVEWSHNYKDSNAFLGGRHGKMIKVEIDSKILEVPSGILPSSIKESDKKDIYRLHMEDQLVYTPEKLAKDYNTASETVDEILMLRDALTNREPKLTERAEMYRLLKENPEIYTIERLAKDFKIARVTAHLALFAEHANGNLSLILVNNLCVLFYILFTCLHKMHKDVCFLFAVFFVLKRFLFGSYVCNMLMIFARICNAFRVWKN